MTKVLALALTLAWASPSWAGWVEDVHDIWVKVTTTIALKAAHQTCHQHNLDCIAQDFHNLQCWLEAPWPQVCNDAGRVGFVCDFDNEVGAVENPFCTVIPPPGCVGHYATEHPACVSTTTTTLPPSGLVARWVIGFNAIGVRMTNGACALRRFPSPTDASYNTSCQNEPDGAVKVGIHIPPMTITGICAWRSATFDETVPEGNLDGVTHALQINGLIIPESVVVADGDNINCRLFNLPVNVGDVIFAGRDLEPFGCADDCPTGLGACAGNPCGGVALGTVIEIFN